MKINWEEQLAQRAKLMRRSSVREFLKHTFKPGMISFAGGLPAPELFPYDEIRKATETVLTEYGSKALQYGETEGIPELRGAIAERYRARGVRVEPEQIVITTGSQQALDLAGRLLINEGDRVIVENPTYLSVLAAWRPLGAQFLYARSDQDGVIPGEVQEQLARDPKLLYVAPNFNNPQGATLSLERRRAVLGFGVPVVEDDPYGELRYEGTALPSLLELCGSADEQVIHTGTFSKVIAPGLRIGWLIGPREFIEKAAIAKQAADLSSSTLNQYIAWQLLASGVLEAQVPKLCAAYRARRDAMLQCLAQYAPPGVAWTRPAGGMFLLISLPEHLSAGALAAKAIGQQVLFVPGDDFHISGGHNTIRLNFSNAPEEKIETGIRRLCELLRQASSEPSVTRRLGHIRVFREGNQGSASFSSR